MGGYVSCADFLLCYLTPPSDARDSRARTAVTYVVWTVMPLMFSPSQLSQRRMHDGLLLDIPLEFPTEISRISH